ncbi:CD82 antigen [Liparis tanakae]|uniref:CD82 antigen n=1 Tax=Liparis tanakae TaxID=230148 RepID=A0A4Z2EDG1_9TELE|nr:CD82 antigen [Liparis tanakae]
MWTRELTVTFDLQALGCSVCGFGLWILFDGGDLLTIDASDELQIVGAGLTLIGLVVLAVSVVGMVGAVRDIRVLLLLYLGLLLVLVLGQLFITLLLLMNRDTVLQFALAVSLYRALGRKDDLLSDPEDDQDYGDQDYGDQDYVDQDYGDQDYVDPDYGDGDPAHPGYHCDYQDYN